MLHVTDVKHIYKKVLWVSFDDGTQGEVDLEGSVSGPVFECLDRDELFAEVYIDKETETITWPNGADLAPEYVKDLLLKQSPISDYKLQN